MKKIAVLLAVCLLVAACVPAGCNPPTSSGDPGLDEYHSVTEEQEAQRLIQWCLEHPEVCDIWETMKE